MKYLLRSGCRSNQKPADYLATAANAHMGTESQWRNTRGLQLAVAVGDFSPPGARKALSTG